MRRAFLIPLGCAVGFFLGPLVYMACAAATAQIQTCSAPATSTASDALIGCPKASITWGPSSSSDLTRTQTPAQAWKPFNTLTASSQVVSKSDGQWHALGTLSIAPPAGTPAPVITPPPAPYSATVTLAWQAPTQNTDGTALTDLDHFTVFQGADAAHLISVASPAAATTSYTTPSLFEGAYVFAVSATNSAKIESAKTPTVAASVTKPAAPATIPNPPPAPPKVTINTPAPTQ